MVCFSLLSITMGVKGGHMQDAYSRNIHEALTEVWKELNFITNELVETNQKLHIIVTNLSPKEPQQPEDQSTSPKREK